MFYHIQYFDPFRTPDCGAGSFNIILFPEFKKMVSNSGITQDNIEIWKKTTGFELLKRAGWNKDYHKLDLRISWGEYGPEHISVPGNACGLDISEGYGLGYDLDDIILTPHNVDSGKQAALLLTIFLEFANTMYLKYRISDDWKHIN